MQHVLDLKADGYTILGVTKSFLSTVMVNKSKVSLDDFRFIANMVSDPQALISNSKRNFNSLDDIIQDAHGEKQQVWIGPGTVSRDHLMALKSWGVLGIDAKWIDYKSTPQSILAMLRDESAVYVGNPADIKGKSKLDIISIVRNMEAIGDIIHRNMFPLIAKKKSLKFDFSEEGQKEIIQYHLKIYKQLARLEETFSEHKLKKAAKIVRKEIKYADLEAEFKVHHLERLQEEREEIIATHEIHMEIMDNLKQISVYVTEIARSVVIVGQ